MILAEVIGAVVPAQQTDWIEDPTLLLVCELDSSGKRMGDALVVLDTLGANKGEWVLVAQGSSARQTDLTKDKPVDAVIAGIVDLVERQGALAYNKGA